MSIKTDDLASSDETKIWNSRKEEEEESDHDRAIHETECLKILASLIVSVTHPAPSFCHRNPVAISRRSGVPETDLISLSVTTGCRPKIAG